MRSQLLEHLVGVVGARVAEDVGVAAHELVADGGDHVVGPERSLGARELGLEDDLEEQVAELGAELLAVAVVDGVDDLARLLEHVAAERGEGLLAVPGAAVGGEQALHQLDEAGEGAALLIGEGRRGDGIERSRHGKRASTARPGRRE